MDRLNITILTSPICEQSGETGCSVFSEESYSLEDYNGLFITDRKDALNFRHRVSKPGYFSSWHIAGDPTLIIVRSGILRISLRDGSFKDFKAGDMFIARDCIQDKEDFNNEIHGHTAELIGDETLFAVHIKLSEINRE